MPTRDGYAEGIPSWVDLATFDMGKARQFYAGLFGWEYTESQAGDMPYLMATKNGRLAAGIGPADENQPFSIWSTHFAVDDANATATKIEQAGGSVLSGPDDIGDMGRFAFCVDPTGAHFGIWQAGTHKGAGLVNEHGTLSWNELTSDDLDTALAFYHEVFGHNAMTSEGASGPYTSLVIGDRPVAGAMPPPVPEIPNHWGVYFAVDNLDESFSSAEGLGGTHNYGPMEAPGIGRFGGYKDSTGAAFTMIQLESPAA